MNCRDAGRLIDTFYDGELDGHLMREAALHVTRCRHCESEIQDRERLHDLLRLSVEREMAGIDLEAIWKGIEPAIESIRPLRPVLSWRIAAASTRAAGLLRGARLSREGGSRGGSLARRRAFRSAGTIALAASLALAVSIALRQEEPATQERAAVGPGLLQNAGARMAAAPVRPPSIAPRRSVSAERARVLTAGLTESEMVRPVASRSPRRGGQVQIESVDSRAGAMAMWSVPASDTAVIWVGTAKPRARPSLPGR